MHEHLTSDAGGPKTTYVASCREGSFVPEQRDS